MGYVAYKPELTEQALAVIRAKVKILEAHLQFLEAKDLVFGTSLCNGFTKNNYLSPKQLYWVDRLVEVAQGFLPSRTKPTEPVKEEIGGLKTIVELFLVAKKKLKFPKMVFQTSAGDDIVLSMTGAYSKHPNTLNVTDGNPFGQNKWFGRIDQNGVWEHNSKIAEQEMLAVRTLLEAIAANPAEAVGKHGKLTGRCAFCNHALSDEKSTAAGYGPTCAKNYGLLKQWKNATKHVKGGSDVQGD